MNIYKLPLIRQMVRGWRSYRFKKQWRKLNLHNKTIACNMFPISVVSVGEGTYGELHIMSYIADNEHLNIGNYVSIAPDVHFILGGNHSSNTMFTYPIRSTVMGYHCKEDSHTKGEIIVEDDVWIGYGATILSGVTIGQGAIIGSKAVITKDVPPYTIVVGNPACIIRKRLPDQVAKEMMKIHLTSIPKDRWADFMGVFYEPLSSVEQINEIKRTLGVENKKNGE